MSLKKDVPWVLNDAYNIAKDAKNAKEFIQTLANTRRVWNAPPKVIIDVPRVGSVIKTTLTSCNYEVVAVYGDRVKVRKMHTDLIIQVGRNEVTKIVRGRFVPATDFDKDSRWLEKAYSDYLLKNGYSPLSEYYNKVQKQIKNKKVMEIKKEQKKSRLEKFNELLKEEKPQEDPGKVKEPGFIKGFIEALERPAQEAAAMREQGDSDRDEIEMDYE